MANLANCCLLLLPCQITRWRRVTYHNPKFAKHPHVPLTHLGGTSRCFASPNCRAEHVNVPPGPLRWGWRCFAIFGLGQGFRQLAAPGRRFCAVCEGLRCATCRYRPLAHRKSPSGGFWWVPMCGCLAEWRRGGTKQERRSDRMVKSPFCGADEARTRDPRRDRPVF